jgi:hypothetical protein
VKFRLPANVDMPDRIVAGLTFRQLVIVAVDALAIWLLFVAFGSSIHLIAFGFIGIVMAASGLALATSTPEGIGVDRLVVLAVRFLRAPKRQVVAPEGISSTAISRSATAMRLPVYDVTDAGFVELGQEGLASLCRASGVNLALRSEKEQQALIEAFSRFLNSLEGPVQVLVVSHRVDLTPLLAEMSERAHALAHPALQRAAQEHLMFLEGLGAARNARRRDVLVCFRASLERAAAEAELRRRVEQAQSLLRGFGVSLHALGKDEAARYLRGVADPEGPQPEAGCDLSTTVIGGKP